MRNNTITNKERQKLKTVQITPVSSGSAPTHTGDVTGDTNLTIADGVVTYAKSSVGVKSSLDLADSAVQPGDLATVATTGNYNDLTNLPAPWTVVSLGSDTTSTSTTAADVSGFNFTPNANKTYLIEGMFIIRTAVTTTGPRPGWTWPSGLTIGSGWILTPSSATASAQAWVNSVTGEAVCNSTGLPVINRNYASPFQALLVVGGSPSGNFQIRLRSEIAASQVTMMAGSFFRYCEL
jgi:hypothetical protein